MLFVDTLREAGFDEKQAKALAKAQAVAIDSASDIRLATKNDVISIREDIQAVKHDMNSMKADLKIMMFLMAGMFAGVGAIFMKLFFPH
jgi:hypothetical protein